MWGFGAIGIQFEFLNVFEQVIENFELTDLYYTKIRDAQEEPVEENVVLVNISDLPRRDIAKQIFILNQHNPKVIGIDAFFRRPSADTLGDQFLAATIQDANNFVMVTEMDNYDSATNTWGELNTSHPMFQDHAQQGFANTFTEESGREYFNTWKKIPLKEKVKDLKEDPVIFAAQIVANYDSVAYKKFVARGNPVEDIYFKGNIANPKNENQSTKYFTLDYDDVLEQRFDPSVVEGKIVLMGYMGEVYNATNWDADKFYTSLNEEPLGRTYPDMYGVVVHANIISMILEGNYVDHMHPYLGGLFAFLLCYFNVAFFVFILKKPRLAPWYGAISKIIQLIEIIILIGLILLVYANYLYKLDFSLAFFAVLVSGDLAEIFMDILGNVFKTHKIEH